MLVARGVVWPPTTQAASHGSFFVILKCIFMNNSYFHFTLLWVSIWLKSTKTANKSHQTVSQIHYSRIRQNCPAEADWEAASPWLGVEDLLCFSLGFDCLSSKGSSLHGNSINRVHKDVYFHSFMSVSTSGVTTATYLKIASWEVGEEAHSSTPTWCPAATTK